MFRRTRRLIVCLYAKVNTPRGEERLTMQYHSVSTESSLTTREEIEVATHEHTQQSRRKFLVAKNWAARWERRGGGRSSSPIPTAPLSPSPEIFIHHHDFLTIMVGTEPS